MPGCREAGIRVAAPGPGLPCRAGRLRTPETVTNHVKAIWSTSVENMLATKGPSRPAEDRSAVGWGTVVLRIGDAEAGWLRRVPLIATGAGAWSACSGPSFSARWRRGSSRASPRTTLPVEANRRRGEPSGPATAASWRPSWRGCWPGRPDDHLDVRCRSNDQTSPNRVNRRSAHGTQASVPLIASNGPSNGAASSRTG
jgi:hypothetical protein